MPEGKYWKRKLNTVTAEYKKWRIFYKHQHSGISVTESRPFEGEKLRKTSQMATTVPIRF
jgi:hypothetical protein